MHRISDGTTPQDIDRRLWLELTAEQYGLVRELIRLEADAPIEGLLDESDRLIEGLANHFPGMGPAIRAVARHIIDDGVEPGQPCSCDRPGEP
jgi:hypothetical protein